MRQLESLSSKPLGLIWYRHPDESHTNDGKHITYHTKPAWLSCDRALAEHMAKAANQPTRTIAFLESLPLFRQRVLGFSESCHPNGQSDWSREAWFGRALERVRGAEIVFVDPDNGIRTKATTKPSPKHIDLTEILRLAQNHKVVVAYHHFDRSQSHRGQMSTLSEVLKAHLPQHHIAVLRYRRISPRAYFCLVQPGLEVEFENQIARLNSHPWDYHWER